MLGPVGVGMSRHWLTAGPLLPGETAQVGVRDLENLCSVKSALGYGREEVGGLEPELCSTEHRCPSVREVLSSVPSTQEVAAGS